MRRTFTLLAVLGLSIGLAGAAPAATRDLAPPVGTSPQVAVRHPRAGLLTAVRIGRHEQYDRVVFQVGGALPGWDVRYVRRVVHDPSGRPVTVAGDAVLRVVLTGVTGHDSRGHATATGIRQTPRLPALVQVERAGDFEAVMTFALGVTDRLDFRVFGLTNPTRVVVDLAHPITRAFTDQFTTLWGTAGGDFTLAAIRTARHPGFDRVVLDLPGPALQPNVGGGYAATNDPVEGYPPTTTLIRLWTFRWGDRPDMTAVATYRGPTTIALGLSNLRTLTVRRPDDSTIDILGTTRTRHGTRIFTVRTPGLTRVVFDIAH